MSYRVLLVGGGSGGHVYPMMAVADALKSQAQQKNIQLELMVLGEGAFAKKAAQERGLKYRSIAAGKYRRYFSLLNILDIFKLPVALVQSFWHLFWFMPDAVFAKGGAASVFPGLVARLYFIPLYLHESDSVPGAANAFLGRMARMVFLSFANAQQYFKTGVVVGNPVRKELLTGDRAAGLADFQLKDGLKTILVIGGSQGAKQINDLILNALVLMVKDYQVIHQCGEEQYKSVSAEVARFIKEGEGAYGPSITENYRLYPFLDSQKSASAYAAADIVISRAGAGSLFEIALAGKPVIVIPLAGSAGNHQSLNALEFAKFGGVVLEGANATTNILLSQIQMLLGPERYASVSQQIRGFAKPDAADKIAEAILLNSK